MSAKGGPWELYNVDADRTELNDLSAKYPDRVAELSSAWQAWEKQTVSGRANKQGKGKAKM